MPEKTADTPSPLLAHGSDQLSRVTVDAYNAELRGSEGFVGDRASKRAFQAILDDARERMRQVGEDPLGETPSEELTKKQLDKVLTEGDTITAADLPERVREARDPVQMQLASGELSVKKTTRIIEEILIRRPLQKTKGNRTRAAELLEISHRALLYKIKDYKVTDL